MGDKMTKDEILAMEVGREFDVLVAKEVFGIGVEWDYRAGDINHILPKLPYLKGKPRMVLGLMAHSVSNIVYKYSADISAAWEVRAKMGEELFSVRQTFLSFLEELSDGVLWPDVFWHVTPEAICKAALLAKLEVRQ